MCPLHGFQSRGENVTYAWRDGARQLAGRSGPLRLSPCWSERAGPGDDGLDEDEGYRYILVMMDDMSNWVWLEPTEACTARLTAQHLLTWCKIIGVPEMWVSGTASHSRIK